MSQNDILTEIFKGMEKKIQSELYSPKSNYDLYSYNSVNFRSQILDPIIKTFFDEIDQLTINEFLLNKIMLLIQRVESYRDTNLIKAKNTEMEKYQISHINYLISEFSAKQLLLLKYVEDSQSNEDFDTRLTKLTKKETALLMLYLQEKGAILPYNKLNDTRLSELFSGLTHYRPDQLRKVISGNSRTFKNEISTNTTNYDKVKHLLLSIIKQIETDLSTFS